MPKAVAFMKIVGYRTNDVLPTPNIVVLTVAATPNIEMLRNR